MRHRTRAMGGINDMDWQKRGCHLKPSGKFLQFPGKRKRGWEIGGQRWGGARGTAGETLDPPLGNTTFSPTPWAHLTHGFPWPLSDGASCIYSDSPGAKGRICTVLNSQGHWQIISPLFSHVPVTLLSFTLEYQPPLCSLTLHIPWRVVYLYTPNFTCSPGVYLW